MHLNAAVSVLSDVWDADGWSRLAFLLLSSLPAALSHPSSPLACSPSF